MIIHERPPNFEQILAAFPDAGGAGVIFAYGDHIYAPSGKTPAPALIAHEGVHQSEQKKFLRVEDWWDRYIVDHDFRYKQELLAHVAEYKAQLHGLDRNYRAKLLQATASRLIAPLYNYKPSRSMSVALRDLRNHL